MTIMCKLPLWTGDR